MDIASRAGIPQENWMMGAPASSASGRIAGGLLDCSCRIMFTKNGALVASFSFDTSSLAVPVARPPSAPIGAGVRHRGCKSHARGAAETGLERSDTASRIDCAGLWNGAAAIHSQNRFARPRAASGRGRAPPEEKPRLDRGMHPPDSKGYSMPEVSADSPIAETAAGCAAPVRAAALHRNRGCEPSTDHPERNHAHELLR